MSAVNQDSRGYIKFLENQIQRVLGQISDLSQKQKDTDLCLRKLLTIDEHDVKLCKIEDVLEVITNKLKQQEFERKDEISKLKKTISEHHETSISYAQCKGCSSQNTIEKGECNRHSDFNNTSFSKQENIFSQKKRYVNSADSPGDTYSLVANKLDHDIRDLEYKIRNDMEYMFHEMKQTKAPNTHGDSNCSFKIRELEIKIKNLIEQQAQDIATDISNLERRIANPTDQSLSQPRNMDLNLEFYDRWFSDCEKRIQKIEFDVSQIKLAPSACIQYKIPENKSKDQDSIKSKIKKVETDLNEKVNRLESNITEFVSKLKTKDIRMESKIKAIETTMGNKLTSRSKYSRKRTESNRRSRRGNSLVYPSVKIEKRRNVSTIKQRLVKELYKRNKPKSVKRTRRDIQRFLNQFIRFFNI